MSSPRRWACAERWRGAAGTVTAEIAVAVPAVVLVLSLALSGIALGADSVRCQDAARVGARELARGESEQRAVSDARRALPRGSSVTASRSGDRVVVAAASLSASDLTAFLAAAGPSWKHGDLRLVAKPVRSVLRRLDDPRVSIERDRLVITGRYGERPVRLPVSLGVDDSGIHWRWGVLRGRLLATEYPLARRLASTPGSALILRSGGVGLEPARRD